MKINKKQERLLRKALADLRATKEETHVYAIWACRSGTAFTLSRVCWLDYAHGRVLQLSRYNIEKFDFSEII